MEPSPRAPLSCEMHPNDLPIWQMVLPLGPNRTFAQGVAKARNEPFLPVIPKELKNDPSDVEGSPFG